jgi:hypothetical protein
MPELSDLPIRRRIDAALNALELFPTLTVEERSL